MKKIFQSESYTPPSLQDGTMSVEYVPGPAAGEVIEKDNKVVDGVTVDVSELQANTVTPPNELSFDVLGNVEVESGTVKVERKPSGDITTFSPPSGTMAMV